MTTKRDLKRTIPDLRQTLLDSIYSLGRLFADEFQCYVQRLRANPACVGSKIADPFEKTLYALADGVVNVESDEEAHEISN